MCVCVQGFSGTMLPDQLKGRCFGGWERVVLGASAIGQSEVEKVAAAVGTVQLQRRSPLLHRSQALKLSLTTPHMMESRCDAVRYLHLEIPDFSYF